MCTAKKVFNQLQTMRLSHDLRLVPIPPSLLPTPIINRQPGSPAAGTCQDERHGLETGRDREKVGYTIRASRGPLLGRVCVCLCVYLCMFVCDVSPTPLAGPAAGTIGRYPDLCVCVCVRAFFPRIHVWLI